MLRAIVFDFDGVIANSEPLHFCAFRDVLAEEHIVLTEADYYARYLGYDDVGVFEAVGSAGGRWTPGRVADLVARKAVRLEALERGRSILFPGAAEAIRRTSAAMPIAIASGAIGVEIRRILEREHLMACFTAIVAAEDAPAGKPAPDPYLRAVALLAAACGGLSPADCVAIEDSRWGLESARAAGLRTVAVTQTYDASALAGAADLIIDSLDSLDLAALARLCTE